MDIEQTLDQILTKLLTLPDERGLSRCAEFYLLYQKVALLKQMVLSEMEQYKNDKLVLEARIKDLEDELKEKEQ